MTSGIAISMGRGLSVALPVVANSARVTDRITASTVAILSSKYIGSCVYPRGPRVLWPDTCLEITTQTRSLQQLCHSRS